MTFTPAPIRRVVTGHDAHGRAVVVSDEHVPPHRRPDDHMVSSHIWLSEHTPADLHQRDDGRERISGTAPPAGGSRLGVLDIAPNGTLHPPHRTDTVDYIICLFGEVELALDDSRVTLRAGDFLIQCGTNHAWVNRGSVPARLAFVLIDAEPKRGGSLGGRDLAR
jgi:quercetin dioxygenase-like cupin family protein